MNLKVRFWLLGPALAGLLLLSACGGGGGGGNTGGGGAEGPPAVNLNATAQDALKFEPATLAAGPGSQVTVKVKNAGALQHNWVLVKGDAAAADQVATAGITAGPAAGYLPTDPNIIANSKLLNGGQEEDVKFTAPAAGTYTYVCTFPGHAATMKGTFTVQ
jgi:azurin